MNPVVVRVAETELADPSEIGRVLKEANALHLVLEGPGGKVDVECHNDAVNFLSLLGGKRGDRAAFEGDDPVVLMSAAEMSEWQKVDFRISPLSKKLKQKPAMTYLSSKGFQRSSASPSAVVMPSLSCALDWFSGDRPRMSFNPRISSCLKRRRPS